MGVLFLFVGGLFGAVAGAGAWASFNRHRRSMPTPGGPPEDRGEAVRRVLKHLQRQTISELTEGTAGVIVGTVHAIPSVAPLRSPVRNVECLGYHLDLRSAQLDPRLLRFQQLHEDARCVAFEVRDDTGAIRVDPDGLELAITDGPVALTVPPYPPEMLARLPGGFHMTQITVEEGLLHPGARILVCGVVACDPTATNYRDGAPALVLRASATFPLVASTDADLLKPGDRPIAPEELRGR